MPPLTQEMLDEMTPDDIDQTLTLVLAYVRMESLIETIRAVYIQQDREEIAERITVPATDEADFDTGC